MRSGASRFGLGIICSFVCITLADDARAQAVSGLSATRVASGLSSPLFSTAPPGDFNRLFIVQQNGMIRILNLNTGILNATPFLTISGLQAGGEGTEGGGHGKFTVVSSQLSVKGMIRSQPSPVRVWPFDCQL